MQEPPFHRNVGDAGIGVGVPQISAIYEATLAAGATFTISVVKLAEGVDDGGPTMDRLTAKFRS